MNFKKLEVYFVQLVQGKKKGPLAYFLKIILRIFSWIYQFIVSVRNWAFDKGCFKLYHAPVPLVISVGNIVVGGTGKTPVTLMLAEEFYKEFVIAILSRGYRSKAEHLRKPVTLSNGKGPLHKASYCGDEPYLISQNLPKAFVFVGKNRHEASNMAARAGAQLILLDDGMQHRHLARDLEVVVMDALDPFGQGFFLPRGFLRESISSLARADLIILNHLDDKSLYHEFKHKIIKYSKAPLIGTTTILDNIYDIEGNVISSIHQKKVSIFCGIAHPEYFQKTIINAGAEIVAFEFISDHMTFGNDELISFINKSLALGAEYVICTEKDFVKLDKNYLKDQPIAWLKMRLSIVEGESAWKKFIEKAKRDLKRRS